jgi:mRNA-degrading endonuclease HigB of HigAB toxin-antitoxin module
MAKVFKNRVISRRKIRDFIAKHPELSKTKEALMAWYREAERAPWTNFAAVRETFVFADQVGRYDVFNIAGNKVWLIALISYNTKPRRIYIKHVLIHREYDNFDFRG